MRLAWTCLALVSIIPLQLNPTLCFQGCGNCLGNNCVIPSPSPAENNSISKLRGRPARLLVSRSRAETVVWLLAFRQRWEQEAGSPEHRLSSLVPYLFLSGATQCLGLGKGSATQQEHVDTGLGLHKRE